MSDTDPSQTSEILPITIEDEMRQSYLDYAMSVIVGRALPDVRDGLKPVHRRVLYAMNELKNHWDKPYKKSARVVGDVIGKYHPHGDTAVYDTMVRMAQPFSMRHMLIDGQGNFGSVDGDSPAAMRYTEVRLARIAHEVLSDLDRETVDFSPNYDGNEQEPTVLPTRVPNLLINGAAGIAVGMATNIPPHNPTEVCNGVLALIGNPDATTEELMRVVRGPDFPTGATIMGREGIKNAYETGRGQMVVRAVAEIEQPKRSSRQQIIVSELPYQVNKAALIEKIAALVKSKRLEGISDIRDESNRQGMRIVIELRSGAQGLVVLNNLYKLTAMQSSFSANMLALVEGMPRVITLKAALQAYIDFRREVVTRRARFELKRARERAHILEGLRIALANLDAIIALIRNAPDVDAAKQGLIEWYNLDAVQAQAILDMQLRRIAALEREKIESEYKELQETIAELEALLADPAKVTAEVARETEELKKKVRGARRTQIAGEAQEFSREELEAHEQVVVTLSQGGYIKRILASTYRNQHRGGKGVYSMRTREDDPVRHILVGDTHDTVLFFTNTGRVLSTRSYELRADVSRNTRGVPVANVVPMSDRERVNAIVGVRSLQEEGLFLVLITRKGTIKRVALEQISKIRRSGLIIMNLKDGDELVTARLAREEDDIIMVTEQGMSIRFAVSEVRTMQRAAGGVKGMTLAGRDRIMAMDVVVPDSKLFVISKRGYGKLTDLNRYKAQHRGGVGLLTLKVTKRTGTLAAAEVIADSHQVYVVSRKSLVLRTNLSEIRSYGRVTQGVTIFKLDDDDAVAAIACVGELEAREEPKALPSLKVKPGVNGRRNGRVASGNGK